MAYGQIRYVAELKDWELPRLADREDDLVDELLHIAPPGYDRERLGDMLYDWLAEELRNLAQVAVNETIEYWLKGLADGNNGRQPDLCIEFPHLERGEEVDALTIAYAVDNQDGTRTELLRTTLSDALERCLDAENELPDKRQRIRILAAELRTLAQRIEGAEPTRS
jgi:hypothetical protein